MASNVQEFLREAQTLTVNSHAMKNISEEISRQAERLANEIRRAAPFKTGKLRDSVRVEVGRRARSNQYPVQYLIRAGGDATISISPDGVRYDYSLGTEFGNEHEAAHPFFYVTARAAERRINRAIERVIVDQFTKHHTLFGVL